jgi:3-phosphoshikimate 1-carboxyvinyltransferase
VLLAGLEAVGDTVVHEAVPTRRHTEEMLELCGARIEETSVDGAHIVHLRPSVLRPFDLTVPGDPSQAAFWVVAACVVPGSEISLPGIYVGAGRRGFLDVLARMGADVSESQPLDPDTGPASADLVARYGPLVATEVSSKEITGLDEVPVLAVAASVAEGTTVFHDVAELRVKESDRMEGIVRFLSAFGAISEIRGDDLVVHGRARLSAGEFHSSGDHRMAMASAVAAAAVSDVATSLVGGWECVATSYPAFGDDLARLQAGG